MSKLLTIAIPTYNRAGYLDICLSHIARQLGELQGEVDIVVSNNCSADNTDEVVAEYRKRGVPITYVRNSENIGPDRNFLQCFNLAQGKYVVVFGDDDIFVDGALSRIVGVLRQGEYGVVHVNRYGFQQDHLAEDPGEKSDQTVVFSDPGEFLKRVNYWITFASGNIFNKSLLPQGFDPGRFSGTNLIQVYWFLAAATAAERNVYISRQLVAAKAENSGGYSVCRVFGNNLSKLMDEVLTDPRCRAAIPYVNRVLLRRFLPGIVLSIRKGKAAYGVEGRIMDDLNPQLKSYLNFWLYLLPVLRLPLPAAQGWHLVTRIINKAEKILVE